MIEAETQPLLTTVAPAAAEGELAGLFARTEATFGFLPNAVQLFGLSPAMLAEQLDYIEYFQRHSRLGPVLLAFIRLLVASRNNCRYCVAMNAAMLAQMGVSLEAIGAARAEPSRAPLPANELALLLLVIRSVDNPHAISAAQVDAVRAHGWSDADLFEAVYHGARAKAVDTVCDTFKVPVDGAFAG